MASWDITIDLPPEQVIDVLTSLADATVTDIPTGIGISFGEGRAAWVDAEPLPGDPGGRTSLTIKDYTTVGAWQVYDHLALHTRVPMQMWDSGGLLVSERRRRPSAPSDSAAAHEDQVVDWDSRAVGAQLLGAARSAPLTPATVLAIVAESGVPEAEVRDRSLELAGELVRAGLLWPTTTGSQQAPTLGENGASTQDLVFATYALFSTEGDGSTDTVAALAIGPGLPADAPATIAAADVRRWMMTACG